MTRDSAATNQDRRSGVRDEGRVAAAIEVLRASSASAQVVLSAADYLDAIDNDDGRHDHLIVDALAPLLEREAAFPDAAAYLDAAQALAEVALRHQRWSIASNALFVLESRLDAASVPAWVRSVRTKLFYRLDPDSAFADPEMTLALLGPLDAIDDQGTAVVREYLGLARDRFRTLDAVAARVRFLDVAIPLLEPARAAVEDLLAQLSGGSPDEQDTDDDDLDAPPTMATTNAPAAVRRPTQPPSRRAERRPTTPPSIPTPASQPPDAPAPAPASADLSHDGEGPDHVAVAHQEPSSPPDDEAAPPDVHNLLAQVDALRQEKAVLEARLDIAESFSLPSGEDSSPVNGDSFTLGRRHLLVLGAVQTSAAVLQGIAKKYGITKDQLRLVTDYDKLTMFDLDTLRYSPQCAGVLIGAVPHSMRGVGSATSAVALLRDEEGFPPSVPMYVGNELKGTKTSFRRALETLRDQMRASGAVTVAGTRRSAAMAA